MLGITDRVTTARVDQHATEHSRWDLGSARDRIDDRTVRLVTDCEPGRAVGQQRRACDGARADRHVVVEQLDRATPFPRPSAEHDASDDRSGGSVAVAAIVVISVPTKLYA